MMPTCDVCGKKYRIVKQQTEGPIRLTHKCPTNPFLTKSMRRIMQMIVDSEDQELANFQPGGWWVESEKVNATACWALLRLCLIKPVWESSNVDRYYKLTEEAFELWKNPKQVPLIIQELRKQNQEK